MTGLTPAPENVGLDLAVDHIGYAVASIAEALRVFYVPCLGARRNPEIFEDPIQKVRVAFLDLPGQRLELIEPIGSQSPVRRVLSAGRGGLYHVGFTTPHVDKAIATLTRNRCRMISPPTPAVAFQGRRIAFFLTGSFDLIEIVEAPAVESPGENQIQAQVGVDRLQQAR